MAATIGRRPCAVPSACWSRTRTISKPCSARANRCSARSMAESQAAAHLRGFRAACRAAGIAVPHQKQRDFLEMRQANPPATRRGLYWQARITLTGSKEEIDRFGPVFETWFGENPSAVK